MDVEAKPIGNDIWLLTDLLRRRIGAIAQTSRGFMIEADDKSILAGVDPGPFPSIDLAMTKIAQATHGFCRIVPG